MSQLKFADLKFTDPSGADIIGLMKEIDAADEMTDIEAGVLAAAKASGTTKEDIMSLRGDDFWAAVKKGNQLFMSPETRPE